MPKYTAKLIVPVANDKLNPIKQNLEIGQGIISRVSVTWTPGSQWLNGFRALYEGGQIIPSEGSGEIRGDGFPDTWDEYIIIDKPHPILNLEAWNDGNDYEHDVLINIVVMPLETLETKATKRLTESFDKVFG